MEIILGAATSLVVEFLKKRFGFDDRGVLVLLFLVAVFASLVYSLFAYLDLLAVIYGVLTTALAFWAVIIRSWQKRKK